MSLTGSGGNATIDTTGGNIDLTGILSGSGGLTKAGSGTLILGGSNNYLGGTIVEEGRLIVENPASLADGSNLAVGAGVSSFSAPLTAAAPVPEPGALAMLAVGGLFLVFYRMRRYGLFVKRVAVSRKSSRISAS